MSDPIVPWMGGKRRLAKRLLPLMAVPHTCYCEPFAGAAAIFFALAWSPVEVLNDLNNDLVNLYRVVQNHLDEFCRQFRHALISRQMFDWAQMAVPDTLTDIQRAARFFYLQKLSFGALGQNFGTATTAHPRLNLLRIEEELSAAHLRLAGVTIEHLPWQECVSRYDASHTLFFCDPPYWETVGYGLDFGLDQYEELAATLPKLHGRCILTVNDHPVMRRVFATLPMESVAVRYTVAGGAGVERHELIIRSRPDGWTGQGRLL